MDVIVCHRQADWDTVGAALLARLLYPQADVVYLGGTLDASPEAFFNFRRPEQIDRKMIDRLIVLGAQRAEMIEPLGDFLNRPEVEVHLYDNRTTPEKNINGTIEVVRKIGACTSLLVERLQERQMNPSAADAGFALLGIYEATGGFLHQTTTADDFRAAAWLLEHGADPRLLAGGRLTENAVEQVIALDDLLRSAHQVAVDDYRFAIGEVAMPQPMADLPLCVRQFHRLVGIPTVFVLAAEGDQLRIAGRTTGESIDINALLGALSGATGNVRDGVATVAGTVVQTRKELLTLLADFLVLPPTARELMIPHAARLSQERSVAEAHETLVHAAAADLLLLTDDGQPAGIVTRPQLDQALRFGLGDTAVEELIDREPFDCEPEATLDEMLDLFARGAQAVLPVVVNRRPVGVVTRESVYRAASERRAHPPVNKIHRQDQTDFAEQLRRQLPPPLAAFIDQVGRLAQETGVRAYLVGGFVRDMILLRENVDLDIVVDGDALALARAAARALDVKLVEHAEFRTATLMIDPYHIDMAGARRDYYAAPGTLPQVETATLEQDALRRDFSLNTLLLAINPDRFGQLLDPHHGLEDLIAGRIRVLHSLSFVEDPTRIFRAIRFQARFGFKLEAHTERLLRTALERNGLSELSGTRIWKEFSLIFQEKHPAEAVRHLFERGVLAALERQWVLTPGLEDHLERAEQIVAWFHQQHLERAADLNLLWWSVLTAPLPVERQRHLNERLELPENIARKTPATINHAQKLLRQLTEQPPSLLSHLARMLRGESTETLLTTAVFAVQEENRRAIFRFLTELEQIKPYIDGNDLKKLGIAPGPLFSHILETIRDEKIDGAISSKVEELELADSLRQVKKPESV